MATPLLGKFLELLAFNAQKFRGSRDRGHPSLLGKFLEVMSVFELLAFNFHDRPLRTHRQTESQTHIISAIHFVHLAEIIIC